MTANNLLRQIRNRYAAAAFYRDEGLVRMDSANDTEPICARFRTLFTRSRSLLWFDFMFTSGGGIAGNRFSMETLGGRLVTAQGINAPYPKYVGEAVAAMTGITFGAAHHVPRMLLPDKTLGRTICADPAHFAESVPVGRETERAIELDATKTILRIDFADMTLREVRSCRDVSEQLRNAALSRGADTEKLKSWSSSVTYEPHIASLEPADLDLRFTAWTSQWDSA